MIQKTVQGERNSKQLSCDRFLNDDFVQDMSHDPAFLLRKVSLPTGNGFCVLRKIFSKNIK